MKNFKKLMSLILVLSMIMPVNFLGISVLAQGDDSNIPVSRQVAEEGMVLLKNLNNALPLAAGEKIALFGSGSIYSSSTSGKGFQIGGGGSSTVNPYYAPVDIMSALESAASEGKISMYQPLNNSYKSSLNYVPDDEMYASAAAFADKAVMVLSRASTEGDDRTAVKGDWYLSDAETLMLQKLTSSFESVIVLANIPGVIDTSWAVGEKEGIDVDSLLVTWYPGMQGGNAVADILLGETSPSGKLTTTFAKSIDDYPSTEGFDNASYTEYKEDIYVGYRYFETFDVPVNYAFGFGLSYTNFSIDSCNAAVSGDKVNVTASVTNNGGVSGKETVQVYYSAPHMADGSALGNPSKELCAFAKTKTLAPGESQTLQLSFPVSEMASFDDTGAAGHKSAMVLEAGDYKFYAGSSVKDTVLAGEYNVPETVVVRQLTQYCAPEALTERLLEDGTYQAMSEFTAPSTADAPVVSETAAKQTFDKVKTLLDVKKGNATIDEVVSQMTVQELSSFVVGHDPRIDSGTGTIGGSDAVFNNYFIKRLDSADGPSGLRLGKKATAWPVETLLACTWNTELVRQMGEGIGTEAVKSDVDVWLAPGANLHRNPLCGRNFEYFSEDPFLSGKMAASVIDGVQSKGAYAEMKHFICNEKELGRNGNDSRVSERALRELYLKPFEMCINEACPAFIMSSYNYLNGTEVSERWDLLTGILRNEFGFDGVVTTDWGNDSNQLREVLAGCNVKMPFGDSNALNIAYGNSGITRAQLEENVKPIIKKVLGSSKAPAVLGISGKTTIQAEDCHTMTNVLYGTSQFMLIGYADSRNNYIPGVLSYEINVEQPGNYKLAIGAVNVSGNSYPDVLDVSIDGVKCGGIEYSSINASESSLRSAGIVTLPEGDHTLTLTFKGFVSSFDYFTLTPTDETVDDARYLKNFNASEVITSSYGVANSAAIKAVNDPRDGTESVYYIDAYNGKSYSGFSYWNKKGDLVFEAGHRYKLSFEVMPLTTNADDSTPLESNVSLFMFLDTEKSQNKYIIKSLGSAKPGVWNSISTTFDVESFENNVNGRMDIYANPVGECGVNYYIDNIKILDVTKKISFSCSEEITGTLPDDIYCVPGGSVKLPKADILREDYVFSGWTDGSNTYNALETVTVNEDMTLSPVWKADSRELFLFNAEPDSSTGIAAASASLSTVTDPRNPDEKVYHIKAAVNGSHSTIALSNSDGLLEFETGHSYRLTFDMCPVDGTAGALTGSVSAFVFLDKVNGNYTFNSIGSASAGSWKTFTYDFTVNSFTSAAANSFQIQTNPVGSSGVNFYADNIRIVDTTKIIKFKSQEACTGTLPDNMYALSGASITLPECTAVRSGFDFAGWSDGSSYYAKGSSVSITSDKTFFAVWKEKTNDLFLFTADPLSSEGIAASSASLSTVTDPRNPGEKVYYVKAAVNGSHSTLMLNNSNGLLEFQEGHSYRLSFDMYPVDGTAGELTGSVSAFVFLDKVNGAYTFKSIGSANAGSWKTFTYDFTVNTFTSAAANSLQIQTNPVGSSGVNFYADNIRLSDTTPVTPVTDRTITFTSFDGYTGTLPEPAVTSGSIILPECSAEFKGSAFVGWTDGNRIYFSGEEFTPKSDAELLAVWTKNTLNEDEYLFDGTRPDFDNKSLYAHATSGVTLVKDPEADGKYAYYVKANPGLQYTSFAYANTKAGYPLKAGHTYNVKMEFCAVGTNMDGNTNGFDGKAQLFLNVGYSASPHVVLSSSAYAGEWKSASVSFKVADSFVPSDDDYIAVYANPLNGCGVNYYLSYLTVTDTTKTVSFTDELHTSGNLPEKLYGGVNSQITIPVCDIKRDGYVLSGWSDGINTYKPKDTYTVSGTTTFTAVWMPDVLSYDSDTALSSLYIPDGGVRIEPNGHKLTIETLTLSENASLTLERGTYFITSFSGNGSITASPNANVIVSSDAKPTGYVQLDIGAKQNEADIRYALVNGETYEIVENNNKYGVIAASPTLVSIIEKTSADNAEIASSDHYYINSAGSAAKLGKLSSSFSVVNGASIRTKAPSGLRLRAFITGTAKGETQQFTVEEYGFIAALSEKLEQSGKQLNLEYSGKAVGVSYSRADSTDLIYEISDDRVFFTGVFYGIPEKNYNTPITVRPYLTLSVGQEKYTIYAEPVKRSIYQVAKAVLEDPSASPDAETLAYLTSIVNSVEGN